MLGVILMNKATLGWTAVLSIICLVVIFSAECQQPATASSGEEQTVTKDAEKADANEISIPQDSASLVLGPHTNFFHLAPLEIPVEQLQAAKSLRDRQQEGTWAWRWLSLVCDEVEARTKNPRLAESYQEVSRLFQGAIGTQGQERLDSIEAAARVLEDAVPNRASLDLLFLTLLKGELLKNGGETDLAEKAYEAAERICGDDLLQKKFPNGHPMAIRLQNDLAHVYEAVGKFDDAFCHAKKAVDLAESLYSDSDEFGWEDRITTKLNLAWIQLDRGERVAAYLLFDELFELVKRAGDKINGNVTADTLHNVAQAFEKLGEVTKAKELMESSNAIWNTLIEKYSDELYAGEFVRAKLAYADFYIEHGSKEELPAIERLLDAQGSFVERRNLGKKTRRELTGLIEERYGYLRLRQGRPSVAEDHFYKAVNANATGRSFAGLGSAKLALNDCEMAIGWHKNLVDEYARRFHENHHLVREARVLLGKTYLACGKKLLAIQQLEKAEAIEARFAESFFLRCSQSGALNYVEVAEALPLLLGAVESKSEIHSAYQRWWRRRNLIFRAWQVRTISLNASPSGKKLFAQLKRKTSELQSAIEK